MGCTIVFHDNVRIFELEVANDFLLARNRRSLRAERHNVIQQRFLRPEAPMTTREKSKKRQLSFLYRGGLVAKMPRRPTSLIGATATLVGCKKRLRRNGCPHVDDFPIGAIVEIQRIADSELHTASAQRPFF